MIVDMRQQLERWILRLKLRHFQPHEVLVGIDEPLNGLPSVDLWGNAALPLIVLDALREDLGWPIHLTSGHRTDAYNDSLVDADGNRISSPRSQHRTFGAWDFATERHETAAERLCSWRGRRFRLPFRVYRMPLDERTPFAELETWDKRAGWASEVVWRGGVGVYPWGVHMDSRGVDADW